MARRRGADGGDDHRPREWHAPRRGVHGGRSRAAGHGTGAAARARTAGACPMRLAVTGADGFLGWHVRCLAFALGIDCVPVTRAGLGDSAGLARTLSGWTPSCTAPGPTAAPTTRSPPASSARPPRWPRRSGSPGGRSGSSTPTRPRRTAPRPGSAYAAAKSQAADILADGARLLRRGAAEPLRRTRPAAPQLGRRDVQPPAGQPARPAHRARPRADPAARPGRRAHPARRVPARRPPPRRGGRPGRPADRVVGAAAAARLRRGVPHRRAARRRQPVAGAAVQRVPVAPVPRATSRSRRPRNRPAREPGRVRAHGWAGGQAFVSTTAPGQSRGDHVHLRKFERFLVVAARSRSRCAGSHRPDDVVRFRVSGAEPSIVDMPTMWAHKLTNVGETDATTFFWSNELLRAEDPDTYPCPVDAATVGQAAVGQAATVGRRRSRNATRRRVVTKVMTFVGTRPEIIRLSRVITRLSRDRRARPGPHRTELGPDPERGLLRRTAPAQARPRPGGRHLLARPGPRRRPGRGRAGPRGRAPGRRARAGRHQQLHRGGDGQADADPGLPHGGRQPLLRRERARRRPTAASSTTSATSTWSTPSTPGATCSPRACTRAGSCTPARRCARCSTTTRPRSRPRPC